MSRLTNLLRWLERYKYVITIVIGIVVVGFIDDNSFMRRIQLENQISDLKAEIEIYAEQKEQTLKKLNELNTDPKAYGRVARELYFMKTADEDIFVLSDDMANTDDKNEKTE